jgi:hypothetical protein
MFADLVGSTALSARMDPEDLREVISAYWLKAQTAHYVGLYGWITALCDAPAVAERLSVRIWGRRVRASYPERWSCGRRRHAGISRFRSIVLLWNRRRVTLLDRFSVFVRQRVRVAQSFVG